MPKTIGMLDADRLYRTHQKYPNLAVMKIAAYQKEKGHRVKLIDKDTDLDRFDHIYISKVFTDTVVPKEILVRDNITIGGIGFYFDKAAPLPPGDRTSYARL